MTHSIDADPAGDLVLRVGSGDEVTLIRVYSIVLSLASPVLAAMLSPRFAEGQALKANKEIVESTTTIDLPDDDPKAMSFLCRTLHFKENNAQRKLYSPEFLMGLGVICDKYRMSKALSPWSNLWMERFHLEHKDDHFDTAGVSYALEHHESFWKSTRDILRHSTLLEINIENSLLPDNVMDILRIDRKKLLDAFQSGVENLITPLLRCCCHTEENREIAKYCHHLKLIGIYVKCLSRRGLWPTSDIQPCSISEVSNALLSFPSSDLRNHYTGDCTTSQQGGLKERLHTAINNMDSELKGLCISCVKYGTSTRQDGNCHAELECQRSD